MSKTPSTGPLRARNNFDLIRLLLASVVFAAHTAELSRLPLLAPLRGFLNSSVAIDGFFIISGFLIFASYENSSSLRRYFEKRARRILPAYFAVVLICAFGLSLVSSLPMEAYFSAQWWRYLAANLSMMNFLQAELPGVFQGQPVRAVNGALWTLKIELMFYLCAPALAWLLARGGKLYMIIAIYALALIYAYAMSVLAHRTGEELFIALRHQLPAQLAFFMAGGLLFYYFNEFKTHATRYLLLALCGMFVYRMFDWYWLYPISLAVLVIYAGSVFSYLGNWGRYGDLSYGVYIWHFPIIQLFVYLGWLHAPAYIVLPGLLLAVFGVAFVSWHVIEKRFLSRASHYRAVERGS